MNPAAPVTRILAMGKEDIMRFLAVLAFGLYSV
jgi:hypothetical protein